MFCQSCGNIIKEEQTFCRMCGEQVSFGELSLPKTDLVKRVSFFSLGVITILIFLFIYFFLRTTLGLHDAFTIILLLIWTLFSAGTISVLLMEMKELKKSFKKDESNKKIENLHAESKQIEEKSFVPVSWSVTDKTTKNLLPTNKSISGDL